MECPEYSEEERTRVILEFLGPAGDGELPLCPACGEALEFKSIVTKIAGLQFDVRCGSCGRCFTWAQPQPEREWRALHMRYFIECYQTEQSPRCPYDDCYVSYAEFGDGVVQFNCPFCNRRGRIEGIQEI